MRRCPTLPHWLGCSTIGAGGLSFRVRNGSGRFPTAIAAAKFVKLSHTHLCVLCVVSEVHSGCVTWSLWPTLCVGGVVSPRPISTSHLNTLLCLQFWPINPMVCGGPYPRKGGEKPHLGTGFPLRCFQRLSLPNVANQQCSWRNNWHARGSSVPVLSY